MEEGIPDLQKLKSILITVVYTQYLELYISLLPDTVIRISQETPLSSGSVQESTVRYMRCILLAIYALQKHLWLTCYCEEECLETVKSSKAEHPLPQKLMKDFWHSHSYSPLLSSTMSYACTFPIDFIGA